MQVWQILKIQRETVYRVYSIGVAGIKHTERDCIEGLECRCGDY